LRGNYLKYNTSISQWELAMDAALSDTSSSPRTGSVLPANDNDADALLIMDVLSKLRDLLSAAGA
jgi:hypothetical protein